MSVLLADSSFVGLDLGTTAIRVVELKLNGASNKLITYGQTPIDSTMASSDSGVDRKRLGDAIKELFAKAQVSTKNVAFGLPSSRVFTTVVDIDKLPENELAKAIRFQADSIIPTDIAESKIDWSVVGESPINKNKLEIILSSVTNEFIESQLDFIESIGLNAIAFEPDNLAMSRALLAPDVAQPQMVLDIGYKSTDLVIAMNGAPRLTRSVPNGLESILRSAVQNLNIEQKQAEQFIYKFGLVQGKLEGQTYKSIVGTVENIISEIQKSIKFFNSRYANTSISKIIISGSATSIPEFASFIANKTGISVEIGNAWRNVSYPQPRQNELLSIADTFATAVGLAERKL